MQAESKEEKEEYQKKIMLNMSTTVTGVGVSIFGLENVIAVFFDALMNVWSGLEG